MALITLVLTVLGDDKPGLVGQLAQVLADHKVNWLKSSMSRLAGQFAGILRVELDPANRADLEAALKQLTDLKIEVVEGGKAKDYSTQLTLCVTANDRTGIVREVMQVLAKHDVNVDQFSSEIVPAPMSGDPLFKASAVLHAPAQFDVDALQRDLEALSDDLTVDPLIPLDIDRV